MCPDIPNPINGQIYFTPDFLAPFDFGSMAKYSCDAGFGLNGGDIVRVCEGTSDSPIGSWSGEAPTCIRKLFLKCVQLGAGNNIML